MRFTSPDYSLYTEQASFGIRLLAGFLDFLIFLVFLIFTWAIEYLFDIFIPEQITFTTYILYTVIFQWRFGRTFGKYHTELCLTNRQGQPISFAQSVNRMAWHWLYVISSYFIAMSLEQDATMGPVGVGVAYFGFMAIMLLVYAIDHFFIVLRDDNRALHDLLAGTRVMRSK